MEHAAVIWSFIVTAVVGLAAIIGTTIASIRFIRKESEQVAQTVAAQIGDRISEKLTLHIAEIGTWREAMEEWKRTFHQSIKEIRNDMRNVVTRQAVLEELTRQASSKIEAMEEERIARHARDEATMAAMIDHAKRGPG